MCGFVKMICEYTGSSSCVLTRTHEQLLGLYCGYRSNQAFIRSNTRHIPFTKTNNRSSLYHVHPQFQIPLRCVHSATASPDFYIYLTMSQGPARPSYIQKSDHNMHSDELT